MVHSERILKYELINSSTTKIYMKKVSHYVRLFKFLKMCILMKADLIPFWFPLVNGDLRGFNFFFICIKKMYSVQILR